MLELIKNNFKYAKEIEGEDYGYKGLDNEQVKWLIEQAEKDEENQRFMKDLVSKLDYTLSLVIKRHNEYASLQEENKRLTEKVEKLTHELQYEKENRLIDKAENERLKEENELLSEHCSLLEKPIIDKIINSK